MSGTKIATWRQCRPFRAVCMLLVVLLVAPPTYGLTEGSSEACQEVPGVAGIHAAVADSEFVRAAALQNLRPIGATVAQLRDGSRVVTSVATNQYKPERPSGTMFFRRDALYDSQRTKPGLVADISLGKDAERDVLWVKVALSLPGDSRLKPASLEYDVEYRASELPAFENLGAEEATALLREWAATVRPLSERASVVRGGVSVTTEDGDGSFERAVESLTTVPLKSRSSCRKACATRYLGPGKFEVACLVAHALVCLGICYVSMGTACVACILYLDKLCDYAGSAVGIFNYLRCYRRC